MAADQYQDIVEHFRVLGREQAEWTPDALDELSRILDGVPVEQDTADADAA